MRIADVPESTISFCKPRRTRRARRGEGGQCVSRQWAVKDKKQYGISGNKWLEQITTEPPHLGCPRRGLDAFF